MNVYGRRCGGNWLYFCQDAYDLSVWPRSIRGSSSGSRDRIVVSTLRCGRNNPGSNPGHGTFFFLTLQHYLFWLCKFFFFFRLKENFHFCHLQLVFNSSRSLILPRSCLVIMYLFISVFTTEKHYYFKVQFYWYLKEILSKENRMDLKYVPIEQICFFKFLTENDWKSEWNWLCEWKEREGLTSGN